VACAQVEESEDHTMGSWGISMVEASVDGGEFTWTGVSGADVQVKSRKWSKGLSQAQAAMRMEDLDASCNVAQGILALRGLGGDNEAAGTDIAVTGPNYVDTDVTVLKGEIRVENLSGTHKLSAPIVVASALEGSVEVRSSGGHVELQLFPLTNSVIQVDVNEGWAQVRLPIGLEYDLQVQSSGDGSIDVVGLNLEQRTSEPGIFYGKTGSGSIEVSVNVTGGTVTIQGT